MQTRLRDVAAIAAACRRLGLRDPVQGTAALYSADVSGLLVHLSGWEFPIAIDVATGELKADNFDGHWKV